MSPVNSEEQKYWLFIGTYESKSRKSKLENSPTIHSTLFSSREKCMDAGVNVIERIYKPIKFFDGAWTCVPN
tara:strand:- start:139 stop:354 length:216 start_codon:yes stop_codon:yes gene_type:complete